MTWYFSLLYHKIYIQYSRYIGTSGKIVFSLLRIITFFFLLLFFIRLLIAKTIFSVGVFASLFFEKVVGTSYSKFESKDTGGGKNVGNAARNLPSSLLISLWLVTFYDFLFNVSSWLNLLDSFKFSRRSTSQSFIDGIESRNVLTNSSVNFPPSISPSKLPIIGFCLSNFKITLNTILYEFCLRKTFL